MARLPDVYGERPVPRVARGIAGFDGMVVPAAIAGVAQSLEQAGNEWSRDQDISAILAARRQLDDWERSSLYDPQTGAVNKTGRNAMGLGEALAKDYDATAGKIASGLASQRQRNLFGELATARRAQVLDWAAKHETQQGEVVAESDFKASVQSMRERAARTPDFAAGEIALQRAEVQRYYGQRKGLSPEVVVAMQSAETSATHAAVLSGMIDQGLVDQAAVYLKANSQDMLERDRHDVERALKPAAAEQKAFAAVNDLMARRVSETAGLEEIRKAFAGEPDARRQAESEWAKRVRERDTDLLNGVAAFWQTTPSIPKLVNRPEFKALDPSMQEKVLKHYRDELYQQDVRANARDARQIAAAERDLREKELKAMPTYLAYLDPAKLAVMPRKEVEALQFEIGPRLTSQLLDKHERLQTAAGKMDAKIDADMRKEFARQAGLEPDKRTGTNAERLGALYDAFDQKVMAFQRAKKAPASYEETRQILQQVVDDTVLLDRSFLPDKEAPFATLTKDQRDRAYVSVGDQDVYLKDIPTADMQQITEALVREGRPVNMRAIADKWVRLAGAGRKSGGTVVQGR